MDIDEVCRLAKKAGLSYGKYVFLHREELKTEKRPARVTLFHRCLCCGRRFIPEREGRRYCSSACRGLAWRRRQEGLW